VFDAEPLSARIRRSQLKTISAKSFVLLPDVDRNIPSWRCSSGFFRNLIHGVDGRDFGMLLLGMGVPCSGYFFFVGGREDYAK